MAGGPVTIVKRRGKWGVKVYDGGQQRWVGTFATQREAKKAEREAMAEQGDSRDTCRDLAGRWPAEAADLRGWRTSTQRQYEQMLRPLVRDLGDKPLSAIDRTAAKAFARKHPASVRFAQAMFADAVKDGLISSNPFLGLRPPRGKGRRDIEALTEAELRDLADTALEVHFDYGSTIRAMILFAGYTGIREGELFALEWADLDGGEATIARAVSGSGTVELPKSGQARRIVIPPAALEALRSMPRIALSPLVFHSRTNKPLKRESHYRSWDKVRIAYGRPKLAWHELRHAAATILLERGVDRDAVAIQLGHRGTRLVDELYGHPSEGAARQRLQRAFAEPTPLRSVAGEVANRAG